MAWMQKTDVTTQDRVEVRVGFSWVGRRRHCPVEAFGHALEARSYLLVPPSTAIAPLSLWSYGLTPSPKRCA
ncbi:unnamed protein product [Hymenolepis diminuta]|uniref:Uncharacterized protein n=1 Tax=Hymenolepis diminuta TaxID=6216 RepID=A0A564YRT3_HYMDI|nr:unnamed protein product [Hymenolepis diminuta]